MSEPFIAIENVSRVYPAAGGSDVGDVVALDGVSLSIRNGERVGIVGDNGAGKSTLLQIIAGVNDASSGRVVIEGKVHAVLTVGLGLREEATGRENLYLEGALLGKTRNEVDEKLEEMIAFADLGDFIDQPVRTYSSGMKARLSFACLVHIDPEILIIDEALAVGDAFFVAKAQRMIESLCERGRIVILVTHSVPTIKKMCARCIWLEKGRIRAEGPAAEVAEAYAEATRERQSAEIARRFGQSGRQWSRDEAVSISELALVRVADDANVALLRSGDRARLAFKLRRPAGLGGAELRVWIERNDGLLFADESVPLEKDLKPAAGGRLSIDLGIVDWQPFLYLAHVELRVGGQATAHAGVVFEIFADEQLVGGNPLLRTPPRLSATDASPLRGHQT